MRNAITKTLRLSSARLNQVRQRRCLPPLRLSPRRHVGTPCGPSRARAEARDTSSGAGGGGEWGANQAPEAIPHPLSIFGAGVGGGGVVGG